MSTPQRRCPCYVPDYNLARPLATERCGGCHYLDRAGGVFDTACRCPKRRTILYPQMRGGAPLLIDSRWAPDCKEPAP